MPFALYDVVWTLGLVAAAAAVGCAIWLLVRTVRGRSKQ